MSFLRGIKSCSDNETAKGLPVRTGFSPFFSYPFTLLFVTNPMTPIEANASIRYSMIYTAYRSAVNFLCTYILASTNRKVNRTFH